MTRRRLAFVFLAMMTGWIAQAQAADAPDAKPLPKPESTTVTEVQPNELAVPRVRPPCIPGKCPFPNRSIRIVGR